ncbi:MAG: glycoside hydrolase family 30 protein [Bacteroidota bacterium]
MKNFLPLFLLAFFSSIGVSAQRVYTINPEKTYQEMESFGASDAWCDLLVQRMNEKDREQAAEWLFSTELDPAGNAKGIGLSAWRFNLGGGSLAQGDSSGISDPFRRADAFIGPEGQYEWNRASGQQWMLEAAGRYGVEKLILFVNSPPVSMTKNGKAFTGECHICNLAEERFDDFAGYMADVLLHFQEQGLPFAMISPVNEPQWGWCASDGQEGNPYTNEEIYKLVKVLNEKLLEKNLDVRIEITESALLIFLNPGYRFKPHRQNQVKQFFSPHGRYYVGDLETVQHDIAGHSYFTVWPVWLMKSVRKRVARVTERYDVGFSQSEYCILLNNREIQGGGRDLGMHTALYISRIIHHDLAYANARSWQWWLGLSHYDYKDGLLYVNEDGTGLTDSRTLWCLGNYSRFIRPGAVRVGVKGKQGKDLYVSAFRDPVNGEYTMVVINRSDKPAIIRLEGTGKVSCRAYETSEEKSLDFTGIRKLDEEIELSPRSVTTFVTLN